MGTSESKAFKTQTENGGLIKKSIPFFKDYFLNPFLEDIRI